MGAHHQRCASRVTPLWVGELGFSIRPVDGVVADDHFKPASASRRTIASREARSSSWCSATRSLSSFGRRRRRNRLGDEGLAGASTGGRALAREDDRRIEVCRRRAAHRAIGKRALSVSEKPGPGSRPAGLPGGRLRPLARAVRASSLASERVLPVGRRPIRARLPPGSG